MASYFKMNAGIHFATPKGHSGAWINHPFSITGVKCSSCKKHMDWRSSPPL